MNKNIKIFITFLIIVAIASVAGYFYLQNRISKQEGAGNEPPAINTPDKKITLVGTVKQLNNNSDPAQYSYELTLDEPFYDELQATGKPYINQVPLASSDKNIQESIKGYSGKRAEVEGSMEWGLAESRFLRVSSISPAEQNANQKSATDTSSWTLYTNKTFGYSLKFPTTYQVKPQTAKHISQVGLDNNTVVEKKSDPSGSSVIEVDVNQDKDGLSLGGYMDKNAKMFGKDAGLMGGIFNGYDSVFNKNQPGNIFLKQGQYVYHISAPTALSDKEIGDILATFKFVTTTQSDRAVAMLQENLSVQYIQRVIANGGTKAYLEPQNEKGDVVEINLIEGGFSDKHTTRIDTFMVNVKTGEILIYDVANNKNISLKDWGMTITQRFPDYGPQKAATVFVQDGSFYGPPFDPNLYQLEISKSEHLFAKSDFVDLKKYLGKNITVNYREVKGVIMSEQQLVIVDSVEL